MPILLKLPSMPQSLPIYPLKTQDTPQGKEVWDPVRKKWMVLTPEEYVRQSLVIFLTQVCGVPLGLISLEKGLNYDRRKKRYDLLVYDRSGKPLILCECKEPRVPIGEDAVQQVAAYNAKIGAKVLILSNGPTLLAFGLTKERKWVGVALPDPDLPRSEGWFSEAERIFS
jgi:hypothetical protein